MEENKKIKFSIFPFLGDISLLIIAFFVAFIVVQHMLIIKSETPQEMSMDQYFAVKEYKIKPEERDSLKQYIALKLFPEIKKKFDLNKLRAVRIEGHADTTQPRLGLSLDGKIELSNRELSLNRAHEINKIFEEIARENIKDTTDYKRFISKLSPSGRGEYNQKYFTKELPNGKHSVIDKKGDQIGEIFDTRNQAKLEMLKKNRRIEIITVYGPTDDK